MKGQVPVAAGTGRVGGYLMKKRQNFVGYVVSDKMDKTVW